MPKTKTTAATATRAMQPSSNPLLRTSSQLLEQNLTMKSSTLWMLAYLWRWLNPQMLVQFSLICVLYNKAFEHLVGGSAPIYQIIELCRAMIQILPSLSGLLSAPGLRPDRRRGTHDAGLLLDHALESGGGGGGGRTAGRNDCGLINGRIRVCFSCKLLLC